MTHVLRIAHLRIAHQVANPEVGKREVHQQINIHNLCSSAKYDVGQLKSCHPSRWTLKLFSKNSTNLSGSGTDTDFFTPFPCTFSAGFHESHTYLVNMRET